MAVQYNLTDTQIRHLAIICYREQGSNDAGVRACASHMCNYYEKYQKRNFPSVYECTFGAGWYWDKAKNEAWVKNHPSVSQKVIDAVKDVIVNGNRSLPSYVDEYDCLSDIKTAKNNEVQFDPKDRTKYIPNVTKILNVYGSSYTFYCFPDGAGGYTDAFGYISKPADASDLSSVPEKAVQIVQAAVDPVECAAQWMEALAADDSHGYSQANRWGPDYDCSSAVITAYEQAGIKVKTAGAVYTGNLREVFLKCGFEDVTNKVNLNTGEGMLRGDVLLYHISGTNGHTAMFVGQGKIAHARGQSYGSPVTGDQGTEIAVTTYSRSKWQYVLRYKGSSTVTIAPAQIQKALGYTSAKMPEIETGSVGAAVSILQALLDMFGYTGTDSQPLDIDGEFGTNTYSALRDYQEAAGITIDGICGMKTWEKLKSGMII